MMSRPIIIKSVIISLIVLILAGIILIPACSHIDDDAYPASPDGTVSGDASEEGNGSDSKGEAPDKGEVPDKENTPSPGRPGQDEPGQNDDGSSEGSVHVITNDKELEEYFDSISDEEIEELLDIIEDIDITDDIDPDADPGFDEVEIPEDGTQK